MKQKKSTQHNSKDELFYKKTIKRACEFIPNFFSAKIYGEPLAEHNAIIKGEVP